MQESVGNPGMCILHLALGRKIMFRVHCRKYRKVPEERQVTLETTEDSSSLGYLFQPVFCVAFFSPVSIGLIFYCMLELSGIAHDLK